MIRKTSFLFIFASLLVLSACGDDLEESGESPADAAPDEGGKLTYALASSPTGLDPNVVPAAVDYRVMRSIYDSLVIQTEDGIEPWLAENWEISNDGTEYTFYLREDVTFHDGTPFNAEAVQYNFERIKDPETQSRFATTLLGPYESSEVVDEHTVRVTLSQPYSPFLSYLSQAFLGIVSPTAAKEHGEGLNTNPVGTGPFEFESWQENSRITLQRNEDYHWGPPIADNTDAPYIDTLSFAIIPEEATRVGSVQSGEVLAADTVPPQNLQELEANPTMNIFQAESTGIPYTLMFNQNHEPWDQVEARKAVQLALDLDGIVDNLYLESYERAYAPLTPSTPAALEAEQPERDLERAGDLFDDIGWELQEDGTRSKDGETLTLYYVEQSPNREKRQDIAYLVQQQLQDVGITVDIEVFADTFDTVMDRSDNELYGVSNVSGDPDILRSFYHTDAIPTAEKWGHNHTHHSSEELDALFAEGLAELDPEKRADIYEEIQEYVQDEVLGLPVYVFPYTVASTDSVDGLKFDTLGYPLFYDVTVSE